MRTVPREIRFYCLCGLKMRIPVDMYGKAGKCVACRQKFWVPKPEELPGDDIVVRLADRPELLRRTGDRVRPETSLTHGDKPNDSTLPPPETAPNTASRHSASGSRKAATPPPAERPAAVADAVSDGGNEEPSAPLDELEPLRQILAYQYLMERQSQDSAAQKTDGKADTDTRRAYRRVIERTRTRVGQRLRELLFETGRRLVDVLGEIAQTTLKFRVGEVGPDAYFEAVGKLRQRREWLERQRVNLKAWLRTENVYLLGGPGGVALENMNLNRIEVSLPPEIREDRPLLQKYIGDMREAFDARAVAERRRVEWRRMVRESDMPEEAMREGSLESAADAERARARIMHFRTRLRQVMKDCDTDISALQAYQQLLAKGVLPRRRGELTQEDVLDEAHTVSEAMADLRLWRDWAANAASAEDPGDLPLSPPTLFRRLAEPNELRRFALESVPAYTAALCLMLLALLPVAVAKAGFLAGMVVLAIVPAFSSRSRRGAAYVAVWVIESFLMGLAWRFAQAEPAARNYLAEPVHLAWVVVASLGAWSAMGVSATLVLRKLAGGYAWVPPTAGAVGLLLFLAALFLGGAPDPQPAATPVVAKTTPRPAAAEPSPPTPEAASSKEVPKEMPGTISAAVAAAGSAPPAATSSPPQSSSAVDLPQNTAPKPVGTTATAPPGNASEKAPPIKEESATANVAPPQTETKVSGPTVELRGVMQKEGSLPRFRIILNAAGGRNRTMDIILGETVYGPWKALEYNISSKKLTLSNAERLVVLDTGETIELPE